MERTLNWLNENKLINALIAIAFFLAVVTFHDEVTVVAIKIRRSFSVTGYNLLFTSLTILGFAAWLWWVLRKVIKQGRYGQLFGYLLPSLVLITLFFLFMQTYAIEAVHFFQYAILAFLLFPLIRSYGATVFWTTLLGMLDEINQYLILTPDFDYFDLNDILLNLLGAGLMVVSISMLTGFVPDSRRRLKNLASVLLTICILALAYFLANWYGLVYWYPEVGKAAPQWFTINRTPISQTFWTKAYGAKYFHIMKSWEGIILGLLLVAWYFTLDFQKNEFYKKIKNNVFKSF